MRTKEYAHLYNQKVIVSDTQRVSGQCDNLLDGTPDARHCNRQDVSRDGGGWLVMEPTGLPLSAP